MSDKNQLTFRIEGMTCDGCARHVTEVLRGVSGVEEAQVPGWQSGRAIVRALDRVSDGDLVEAVRKGGYNAVLEARRPVESERRVPAAPEADYDLMIVGGGSAAFAAAIKGAELGAKVAIAEQGTIGGTCVNIGCVPSKTLIKAAELCFKSAYPRFEGLTACPPPSDWQRVVQQKNELVAALREGKYVHVMEMYPNISLVKGRAVLTGKRSVAVDGKAYAPGKILLATGSSPWAPPIPGLSEAGFLDSTQALDLPALPKSMIVVGGGAIGLELAQLFNRFGVKVTVLEGLPRIAPAEEPEIGEALARYLAEERMTVHAGVKIHKVGKSNGEYKVECEIDGRRETVAAEQLLVATGRRPNTAGLGLEAAGIATGRKGEIVVDKTLRTANEDVYAAGDCIGDPMFVYVSAYGGGLAAENALTGAGRVFDLFALPRVTFTDPQIASVGHTEAQAREAGIKVKTATLSLKDVPRALAARDTRGLIKLVADAETDRLVGAHVLATEGGEIIQEATLAIRFGLKVTDIVQTFHPYLTMVEGLKLAALTFNKDVAKLSCCAT